MSGPSTARYSRMCEYGFANDRPSIPSMTIWCDKPMPRPKRPRQIAAADHRDRWRGGGLGPGHADAGDYAGVARPPRSLRPRLIAFDDAGPHAAEIRLPDPDSDFGGTRASATLVGMFGRAAVELVAVGRRH